MSENNRQRLKPWCNVEFLRRLNINMGNRIMIDQSFESQVIWESAREVEIEIRKFNN